MAALSVHTKLALGPRRARPSPAPGSPISCGLGVSGAAGGLGALGAALRRLLASPTNVPEFVLQQFRGDCEMCPTLRGGRSGRAWQRRRGADRAPGAAPPCATLCPGLLLPRPPLSSPTGPNPASAPQQQQRAFPGCGAGAPRHNLSGFCCGGRTPVRIALRPVPQRPAAFPGAGGALPRMGRSGRQVPLAPPLTASPPRTGVVLANFCGWAPAPSLLPPAPTMREKSPSAAWGEQGHGCQPSAQPSEAATLNSGYCPLL